MWGRLGRYDVWIQPDWCKIYNIYNIFAFLGFLHVIDIGLPTGYNNNQLKRKLVPEMTYFVNEHTDTAENDSTMPSNFTVSITRV